ncbi:hypothetical protein [Streptomyces sp. NPDC091416]|uniref:hypothetical protein n=1 Tax=Streptomyces sp. NPDC091416 TaxID=3366003 RepID=UPI003808139A
MTGPDSEWQLLHGGTLVGTITVDEAGMPWQRGRFFPEPAFSQFKPWFDELNAILQAEEFERFDDAYDRIESALGPVSLTVYRLGRLRVVHGGAVKVPPEGGLQNGGEVFLGDRGAHVRQSLRKGVIADDAHVFLTELVDDLDELWSQPHPGTGGTDLFIDLVHEPAHDLVRDVHVPCVRVEAHHRFPCRILVGNDCGHEHPLPGHAIQFQIPGVIGHGVHRGDRVVAGWVSKDHCRMLPRWPEEVPLQIVRPDVPTSGPR